MWRRSALWFFAGFAAGALCITAILWTAGGIRMPEEASREAPPELPAAPRLPDTNPLHQPRPPLEIPPAPPAPQGGADRAAPAPDGPVAAVPQEPRLLIPVEDARPEDIVDTFEAERPGGRRHEAVDIMAPRGTPVLAADEGNIIKLFHSKPGGLTIYQFDNTGTWCYYYAHLDRYETGLQEGMLVRKGQRIGYVGSTGDASAEAPHLHFAVFRLGPEKRWWEGTPVNPYPMLAPGPEAPAPRG